MDQESFGLYAIIHSKSKNGKNISTPISIPSERTVRQQYERGEVRLMLIQRKSESEEREGRSCRPALLKWKSVVEPIVIEDDQEDRRAQVTDRRGRKR